jgi:hypothetical protein
MKSSQKLPLLKRVNFRGRETLKARLLLKKLLRVELVGRKELLVAVDWMIYYLDRIFLSSLLQNLCLYSKIMIGKRGRKPLTR